MKKQWEKIQNSIIKKCPDTFSQYGTFVECPYCKLQIVQEAYDHHILEEHNVIVREWWWKKKQWKDYCHFLGIEPFAINMNCRGMNIVIELSSKTKKKILRRIK